MNSPGLWSLRREHLADVIIFLSALENCFYELPIKEKGGVRKL
jgi:hypothetical protein